MSGKFNVRWSASQARFVIDSLMACKTGRIANFVFDDADHAALDELIAKARAAHQVALEDYGVRPSP